MSKRTFGELSQGRRNNFDFLRLVLAILVILSHSYPLLQGNNANEIFMRLTGGQITGGELAVNGFFILSGFLIAQSWEKSRTAGSYFKKRVLRIYPGFLATVLFCGLIAGPLLASSFSEYWRQFAPLEFIICAFNLELRLPKLFDHLPISDVNGSLWSIRYEFFCYIGVAFLGIIGAFRKRAIVVAAFALTFTLFACQIYFGMKMPGSGLSYLYCYPERWPRLATFYLAGVLFYLYRERLIWSVVGCAVMVVGLLFFALVPELKFLPLALPFLGTYLFFYVAFLPIPRLHNFASRGDFSYGVYLYAFPVQQWFVYNHAAALNPTTLFWVSLPITCVLAFLSWHLVEKPCMAKKAAAKR